MTTTNDVIKQYEDRKREAFDSFMASDMVKMVISKIPPGDDPDALKTLLRTCYDHGFACGSLATMLLKIFG